MRHVRLALLGAMIAALLAACGGSSVRNLVTSASEGRITGRMANFDGTPAAGLTVRVDPPSFSTASSASTGADGSFALRAPAGPALLLLGGGPLSSIRQSVTIVANQTTDLGWLAITGSGGEPLAGNSPAAVGVPTVAPAAVAPGGPVTITVTVTDPDTTATDLQVVALVSGATGLVGAVTLAPTATPNAFAGIFTTPADQPAGTTFTVTAAAVDSPGSEQAVTAAGTTTFSLNP